MLHVVNTLLFRKTTYFIIIKTERPNALASAAQRHSRVWTSIDVVAPTMAEQEGAPYSPKFPYFPERKRTLQFLVFYVSF
jgi:hypothetical protein